ncbi:MAG: hypothetical protein PHO80_01980, partial [Candidatus Gracilibacteria bacterium]|nr:hypothetical protein [Candidatus Gracilibacteria bacterium]
VLKKFNIPAPTLCPDCRQQRRLAFRNERKLYKRKCDLSGKEIISIYSPDKPYKVYGQDEWWSDKWDPMDYGRDFDFGRGFFEQFEKLSYDVPKSSILNKNLENSYYCGNTSNSKNCYLCFVTTNGLDSYYLHSAVNCTNCMDLFWCYDCIDCYDCVKTNNSYNCFFCFDSSNCSDCRYIINGDGLKNCYFCNNLKNKQYYILNKEYSKEEYNKIINKIDTDLSVFSEYNQRFEILNKKIPYRFSNIQNSENCSGDYITNSNNCLNSFAVDNVDSCKYCYDIDWSRNCYDLYLAGAETVGTYLELSYEIINSYRAFCVLFCSSVWEDCKYSFYLDECFNCSNCFGCIGLRNKKYCILNKQYTKEEYEKLVPKIIEHMKKTGEWGEFFPASISPFGYNETEAQERFVLTKEEVIKKGFKWSDYEPPFPKVEKIIPANKLPDNIKDIPDDILNRAIECEVTKKLFRIIKQELEFYRKHNLPIPKKHPDQRHLDRMNTRNPRKIYDRKCDKCGTDIKTTYSPDRSEIVYCEGCYNKEFY